MMQKPPRMGKPMASEPDSSHLFSALLAPLAGKQQSGCEGYGWWEAVHLMHEG